MFTLWTDIDRAFFGNPWHRTRRSSQQLARQVERLFESGMGMGNSWHRVNLLDKGEHFEFVAELPGVTEQDIEVNVHQDVLTVRAQRRLQPKEGWTAHRNERSNYSFQRSVSMPTPVDAELTKAVLKDGILRVQMAKAPEHKPRQIAVTAG
ncbi:MAG: Hsp20/alpha crystallin family protein [Myxococcota bacterium]|jgi:HSP20 family protein|nr:Hsp20/alpha crystallin family protein [Myxococcota bacterium]